MKKAEIDYWIGAMLDAHDSVSDLNITVGKTLQVEANGILMSARTDHTAGRRVFAVSSQNRFGKTDICPFRQHLPS